jgi:hypothetical protein
VLGSVNGVRNVGAKEYPRHVTANALGPLHVDRRAQSEAALGHVLHASRAADLLLAVADTAGRDSGNVETRHRPDAHWEFRKEPGCALDPAGVVSLRGSLGFINYGNERLQFCSVYSCRVGIDLDTSNNIVSFGVGPELAFQVGPVRPYARAALGIGYFVTTSGLSGDGDWDRTYASTDNYDDVVFQRRLGGGLGLRLSNGRYPVWLDVSIGLGGDEDDNFRAERRGR